MDLNAHIEYLARSNNMRRLDDREAQFHRILESMERGSFAPMVYCNSFSARNRQSGEMIFYIDPDEHDGEPTLQYFIALHEIGHQVLGHANSEQGIEQVVENEIAAWEWALEHSLIDATDDVYLMMMDSVGTYTDNLYQVGLWKKS